MSHKQTWVRQFDEISSKDTGTVGGKNASLGEMIRRLKKQKILVPSGFATTADAYWEFLRINELEERICTELDKYRKKKESLQKTGQTIRQMINRSHFPQSVEDEIRSAYQKLCKDYKKRRVDVAVRSSATAEDLPDASFAGQQETFLNILGADEVLKACRKCYMSLFTDRAISYREEKKFDHMKVALSACVQKMVRSDLACSGVMFSLDTDTGFPDAVVINASWGLGENIVQGSVTPDEYTIFKPLLGKKHIRPLLEKVCGGKEKTMVYAKSKGKTTKNVKTSEKKQQQFVLEEEEILKLARWAVVIEKHYGKPMDIEWAKDGQNGELFIVQARPETVWSQKKADVLKSYRLKKKGKKILKGLSIGQAIATGKVQIIKNVKEIKRFKKDNILVTGMTDPDWVPIMKKAAGIITDHGGRTSHAAIVSRELGLPAVVGTDKATQKLEEGQEITLSYAEGDQGYIYQGVLDYEESEVSLEKIPSVKTRIMMNIATPAAAFRWWQLPCRGIGLARMEFIINNIIKVHPMALIDFNKVEEKKERKKIEDLTSRYQDKREYFIDHLASGIARIAASQYPEPVIVRMSDFKTNEYANLIGGKAFEQVEENPMIGFRGASRYYSDRYRPGFELECQAVKRAREVIGLSNILIMIPFCRTLDEADRVLKIAAKNGLKQGQNGLKIYVMCEIPSNVILGEEFAQKFDGFSIGSNDLTQLVLGVSRDSEELSSLFNESDPAVKSMIRDLIKKAHKRKCKVGFCGQAPSDNPEFAEFLVRSGIDSISLNPDSVVNVISHVAKIEDRQHKD